MIRIIIFILCVSCTSFINAQGLSQVFGAFKPQYEENSEKLKPRQCWGSTGLCWCAYDSSIPPFPSTMEIVINCPTEQQANSKQPASMKRRLKQEKVQTAIEKVWLNLKEKAAHTLEWFKGFSSLLN